MTDFLYHEDGSDDDRFGWTASIYGDFIAIGAYTHDTDGYLNCGAVYIYRKENENWTFFQKIKPFDEKFNDKNFGHDICISGNF